MRMPACGYQLRGVLRSSVGHFVCWKCDGEAADFRLALVRKQAERINQSEALV
jgi:hypothetical protein